jgi:hypothetical protein
VSRASIWIDPSAVELGDIAVLSILLFLEVTLLRLHTRIWEPVQQ